MTKYSFIVKRKPTNHFIDGTEYKICSKCKEDMSLDKFYHNRYGGYTSICIDCRNKANRERYRLKKLNAGSNN